MLAKFRQHFPRLDRAASSFSGWQSVVTSAAGVYGVLAGVMTWPASTYHAIAEQGWGAIVFAALAAAGAIVLLICVFLISWRYFNPISPQPQQPSTPPPTPPAPPSRSDARPERLDPRVYIPLTHLLHIERLRLAETLVERWINCAPAIPKLSLSLNKETMAQQTKEFSDYCANSEREMYRINLGHDYDSLLRNTEYQADAEVVQTEVPAGLPPLEFRRWFIARAKARQAVEFLKNKKLEYENMLPANISQIAEQERNLTIRPG